MLGARARGAVMLPPPPAVPTAAAWLELDGRPAGVVAFAAAAGGVAAARVPEGAGSAGAGSRAARSAPVAAVVGAALRAKGAATEPIGAVAASPCGSLVAVAAGCHVLCFSHLAGSGTAAAAGGARELALGAAARAPTPVTQLAVAPGALARCDERGRVTLWERSEAEGAAAWRERLSVQLDAPCSALAVVGATPKRPVAVAAAVGAVVHVLRPGEGGGDGAGQQLAHRGPVTVVRWGRGGGAAQEAALLTLDTSGTGRVWVEAPQAWPGGAPAAAARMCLAASTDDGHTRLVALDWLHRPVDEAAQSRVTLAGVTTEGDVRLWECAWVGGNGSQADGGGAWCAPVLTPAGAFLRVVAPLADARAWHLSAAPDGLLDVIAVSRLDARAGKLERCTLRRGVPEALDSGAVLLCGHANDVVAVDACACGEGVFAASVDAAGNVQLWEAREEALAPLMRADGDVLSVAAPEGCTRAFVLPDAKGTGAVACVRAGGVNVVRGRELIKAFELAEHAPLGAAVATDACEAGGRPTRWLIMSGSGGESLVATGVVIAGASCALLPPIVEAINGGIACISALSPRRSTPSGLQALAYVGTADGAVQMWALGKGAGGGARAQWARQGVSTRAHGGAVSVIAASAACGAVATAADESNEIAIWDAGLGGTQLSRVGRTQAAARVWSLAWAHIGGQRVLLAGCDGGSTVFGADTTGGAHKEWVPLARIDAATCSSGRAAVSPVCALAGGLMAVVCGGSTVLGAVARDVAPALWRRAGPVPLYHPRFLGERLAAGDKPSARAILRRLGEWLDAGGPASGPFDPLPLKQLLNGVEGTKGPAAGAGESSGNGNGWQAAAAADPMASGMLDPSMFGFGGGPAAPSPSPSPSPFSMGVASAPAPRQTAAAASSEVFSARDAEELAELVSTAAELPRVSPSERVKLLHLIDELAADDGSAAQRGALDYYAERAWLGGTTVTAAVGGNSEGAVGGSGAFGALSSGGSCGRHIAFAWTSIAWGCFSDTSEALLDACMPLSTQPTWSRVAALGAGWWLARGGRGARTARAVLERIARAEFAASRKPENVALWYLALGRRNVLMGLYRSVNDQRLVAFLSRDFSQQAHRTAASKNAYALLGQHRYRLAAAFFLLAGNLSEAVSILALKEPDAQLAAMVAAVVEEGAGEVSRKLMATELERADDEAKGAQGPVERITCAWRLCVMHACAGDSVAAAAALAAGACSDARAFDMVDAMARRRGASNRGSLISPQGLRALAAGAVHTLEATGLPLAALRRLHAVDGAAGGSDGAAEQPEDVVREAVLARLARLSACWAAADADEVNTRTRLRRSLDALADRFGAVRDDAGAARLAHLHVARMRPIEQTNEANDDSWESSAAGAACATTAASRQMDDRPEWGGEPVEVLRAQGEPLVDVCVDPRDPARIAVAMARSGVTEARIPSDVLLSMCSGVGDEAISFDAFPPFAPRWLTTIGAATSQLEANGGGGLGSTQALPQSPAVPSPSPLSPMNNAALSPWALELDPPSVTPDHPSAQRTALAGARPEEVAATCLTAHPSMSLFLAGTAAGQALLWPFRGDDREGAGDESAVSLSAYGESGANVAVVDVAFNAQGSRFATASAGGAVSLWRLDCGGAGLRGARDARRCFSRRACGVAWLQGASLDGAPSVVSGLGSVLAAVGVGASQHEDLVIWDALLPPRASAVAGARLHADGAGARAVCVAGSAGSVVISGGRGGAIAAIDLRMPPSCGWGPRWAPRALWMQPEVHPGGVRCVRTLCGGAVVVSAGRDGAVRALDAATGDALREWPASHERRAGVLGALAVGGGVEAAVGIAPLPGGGGFVSCGADGAVNLFSV